MSDDSQAFIREIEQEVRREKLGKMWNQYGVLALGVVSVLVLLIGGWQWYTAYQKDRAQTAGGQYIEAVNALEGDKKADGLAALEQIIKEATPAYATLAKLRLAAEKREAGGAGQALTLYSAVADDSSVDRLLSSFASLQIASLKVDGGSWTEVQNRLNSLADDSSPWRHSARELLGVAAYKHQEWSEAKQAFTSILGDQSAPDALKQRAQIALALITRDEPKANTETPTKPGADQTDLKKDKSSGDGQETTAGAGKGEANSTPSSGVGANNDAVKPK